MYVMSPNTKEKTTTDEEIGNKATYNKYFHRQKCHPIPLINNEKFAC